MENITGAAPQSIDEVIPKTLDDVIRKNRELFELGLATADELEKFKGAIQPVVIKDILDDWRLICLREKQSGRANVLLLGHSRQRDVPWITSAIVRIDLAHDGVLTRSASFYGLGSQGCGQPSRGQLLHLCVTLHQWGTGSFLGVPHFFY